MKSSIIHFLNLKLKRCEVTWSSWSCWVSFIKRSCLTKTAGRLGRPCTSTDHQSTKDDFLTAHWKFMKTISPNGSGKWVPPILVSFHYSGWSFHFHDCGRKGIISVKIMEGKNCFFTFQIQPFSTEPWWEDEYSTMCAFFQWFFFPISGCTPSTIVALLTKESRLMNISTCEHIEDITLKKLLCIFSETSL